MGGFRYGATVVVVVLLVVVVVSGAFVGTLLDSNV
jgi:hypothetical protein